MITTVAGPIVSLRRCAIVLAVTIDDAALGAAVRRALALSLRSAADLTPDEDRPYEEYHPYLARLFGLTSTKTLFQSMRRISIDEREGRLNLIPMIRKWGGLFSAFRDEAEPGHEVVNLPESCSDAELGSGVRLALARCL